MIKTQVLDDLSKKIRELAASGPAADAERNVRALLQGAFTKLELVNREEFDVQTKVLLRTREKLNEMEAKLAQLERQLAEGRDEQACGGTHSPGLPAGRRRSLRAGWLAGIVPGGAF